MSAHDLLAVLIHTKNIKEQKVMLRDVAELSLISQYLNGRG